MNLKENLETIFSRLENMFKAKTVIGDPITIGEITLVPVVNVTFGIGAGGGESASLGEQGGGGLGAGTGARMTPSAIVVINGNQVSLLPVEGRSSLGGIIEQVPELISELRRVVRTDGKVSDDDAEDNPEDSKEDNMREYPKVDLRDDTEFNMLENLKENIRDHIKPDINNDIKDDKYNEVEEAEDI